jgi:hypothetical protein
MDDLRGSCHCGAVEITYSTAKPLPLRRCGCGFCRRHGSVYTTDPAGHLTVKAARQALGRYRFGHRTADFLLCAHCGVLVAVTAEIDGTLRGVVNLAVMEPRPDLPSDIPVMDVEGESEDDRINRRRRNWIGHVEIKEIPS